jgi:ABC-2 type transport system permease protein
MAQPIHRDDVINGKFVAGISVIGVTLGMLTLIVAGLGIRRLGITPHFADLERLVTYLVISLVYIGVWLAFAILVSVSVRRAATSAVVCIAAWLVFTLFQSFIVSTVADQIAKVPSDNPTAEQVLRNANLKVTYSRLSPQTLYEESSQVMLDPSLRSVDLVTDTQADQAVPGALSFRTSFTIVWAQLATLVALIVVLFAAAYIIFLRQEIRA